MARVKARQDPYELNRTHGTASAAFEPDEFQFLIRIALEGTNHTGHNGMGTAFAPDVVNHDPGSH